MNGMNGAGGSQQSPWEAQNQAAAGNPGGGDGYRAIREWGERDRLRARGLPYGVSDPVTDANAQDRMKRFCPEWDGDMRWAPPGFMAQEAARTRRADEIERKEQAEAGYHGPVPGASSFVTPMSPAEAHHDFCDRGTKAAFARNDAMWARFDARDAQERQQLKTQQGKDQDQWHARKMQQAQFDHELKMRQLELNAQRRGWGR